MKKKTSQTGPSKQTYISPGIEIISITMEGVIATSIEKTNIDVDGPARSRKNLWRE